MSSYGLFEQELAIEPIRGYGDKSIRVRNPRTYKWGGGGGGSRYFETSLVMASYYGYEIWRHK